MREAVTISLPKKMKRDLDRIAKDKGVSRSNVVQDSLRTYLFRSRLDRIREELIPRAQAQGIFTDQDVFDRIS
jgi:metal-responsive CopG/Arc/MetJ family transcriptional regulator